MLIKGEARVPTMSSASFNLQSENSFSRPNRQKISFHRNATNETPSETVINNGTPTQASHNYTETTYLQVNRKSCSNRDIRQSYNPENVYSHDGLTAAPYTKSLLHRRKASRPVPKQPHQQFNQDNSAMLNTLKVLEVLQQTTQADSHKQMSLHHKSPQYNTGQ